MPPRTPRLRWHFEEPAHVLGIVGEEEIDIACEPHVAVEDHGLSSDDQIPHAMSVQQLDEDARVRREVERVYSDR